MRLGLYLTAQHPPQVDAARVVPQLVEQVRLARDLGFSVVMAGQHFLSQPYWTLQNVPLLARLAADAGDMRIGTGILLLTLLNPVEVAESLTTLDAIADGRVIAGFGMGYRDVEDAAFGVLKARRAAIFEAKLAVVRGLLAGEEVTAEGPGYRIERASLPQAPRRPPPIWIAANGDAGVRRAARLGDAWFANPHGRLDELERQARLFRDVRRRAGWPPDDGLPVLREVAIAPGDREAVAVARRHLAPKYAAYVDWGQARAMPPTDTLDREWSRLAAGGRFVVGSPAACSKQLRELGERVGADEVLCRVQWPGMPHAEALRALRLLGEAVLPTIA